MNPMTTHPVQRAYVDGRFGQIHYRRAGSLGARSPLLLLHPGRLSSLVFEGFMPEIGRDRTVIAPDTPGCGMSDAPPTPPTIGDYASTMLDLVDALGLGMVDVLGYHTGALVAVDMARRQRSAVVRRIVMVSAAVLTPEEAAAMRTQYAPKPLDARPSDMAQTWPTFRREDWRMELNDARAWNIFLDSQRGVETGGWNLEAAMDYPLAEALPHVENPILVLNPKDELSPFTARAAKLLKNGHIHDLPEWGHGFFTAKGFETAAIVREFLA